MPKSRLFTIICMSLLLVIFYGCNKGSNESDGAEASTHEHEHGEQTGEEKEHKEQEGHEHEKGEHAGEEKEHKEHAEHKHEKGEQAEHKHEKEEHAGEGEEAGPRISKDGTHDEVRKGVRIILSFDNESSSFIGTVENVTKKTISKIRVEVHLSNGKELGPTKPIKLAPGKKVDVKLSAEGQSFTWWKAHAEAGASEH